MSDGLYRAIPKSQYTLYEVVEGKPPRALGAFDSLTGGEQVISMVHYNVMDERGNVTTKFIPGQTTFEPVVLLRPMDIVAKAIYKRFWKAVAGQLTTIKKNYSVSMNDSQGEPLVYWHLSNALPVKISGFDFNMTTESEYTSFEISFQAESIEVEFTKAAKPKVVSEALDAWDEAENG